MNKNWQSKSPTPIGWVDYLDIWAKSKISKNCNLDFLDFSSTTRESTHRARGAVLNLSRVPVRACIKVQIVSKNNLHLEQTLTTLGGRVTCQRCQAQSKRTKLQCAAPAIAGKWVCKTHGGTSTGPKTEQGRQRCAEAKTIHGNETRKARTERAEAMRRLRVLEDLGHALGFMEGARTPGRKPKISITYVNGKC